jgi:hypothetical protein
VSEQREHLERDQAGVGGTTAPQDRNAGQQQPPPAGTDEGLREDYAAPSEHPLADPDADPREDDQDRRDAQA